MEKNKKKRRKKYDILRFLLKCVCIPAAAVLIILYMNKFYRKIDDGKYMDITKFSTLGIYVSEVQIGNLGSSHGAYDFNYDALTERGYSAVGGEAVALLLPVLWYLISQTVRDFTKDAKNGYLPDYKEENEP